MFPEVMQRVVGAVPASVAATLPHFSRRAFHSECFPGVVPAAGSLVRGVVYTGVSAAALNLLDAFEGDYYERQEQNAVSATGEAIVVFVYVVQPRYRRMLKQKDWDAQWFRQRHLKSFLRAI